MTRQVFTTFAQRDEIGKIPGFEGEHCGLSSVKGHSAGRVPYG